MVSRGPYAIAGAIGPVIMGKAFDATESYQMLLTGLSVLTLAVAGLMLFLPRDDGAPGDAGMERPLDAYAEVEELGG